MRQKLRVVSFAVEKRAQLLQHGVHMRRQGLCIQVKVMASECRRDFTSWQAGAGAVDSHCCQPQQWSQVLGIFLEQVQPFVQHVWRFIYVCMSVLFIFLKK